MTDINPELLQIFREEADERIERIADTLVRIEGGDASPEALGALFRDAHSIKGVAGLMGYDDVYERAHAMEDELEQARAAGALAPELIAPLLSSLDAIRQSIQGGSSEAVQPAVVLSPAATPARSRSMRVDARRVDSLLDTVGETVLHHRRLEHVLRYDQSTTGDDDAEDLLHRGERLLDELQHSVIQLRTLPLSSITGPYPRTLRDLAASLDKDVELVFEGTETQLDRVVLEGAAEAISHLLRNAVAHGVESAEERERAGKPRRARIVLRAQQFGDRVAIEVADDGRGVAPELLERARLTGSLADVLAEPGSSTAETITEVSGRGVGLDAVRHHLQTVGGELEIQSQPGAGTVARLLVPVSLVLLQVLLVECEGSTIGIPLTSVSEIRRSTGRVSLSGRPGLRHGDDVVPLRDLLAALGGRTRPLPASGPALIVNAADQPVALLCDRIVGEQHVIVKSLGPILDAMKVYLGSTILGDGGIALIADPSRLEVHDGRRQVTAAATPDARAPTVLVVDDQFTVRELQRGILQAAGYDVETARDGREAWNRLSDGPDPDLVITDLEMPEMDGIELVEAIRRRTEGSALPVIILTSRSRADDERRGLDAGADAYIVKERFDQQALIDTVERLIGR